MDAAVTSVDARERGLARAPDGTPRPVAACARAGARPRARGGSAVGVWLLALMLIVIGLGLASASARADNQDDRRVRTGARLFRALLAADIAIDGKSGPDGALDVAIYVHDRAAGDSIEALLIPPDAPEQARVRGLPIHLRRLAQPEEAGAVPIAVFLGTPIADAELDRLIDWSIRHHVILYSPFEGHVERGVLAGLSIEAKVLPYINQRTLTASGVELKPFFMKVAKVHR